MQDVQPIDSVGRVQVMQPASRVLTYVSRDELQVENKDHDDRKFTIIITSGPELQKTVSV
jgi:hypothetical protein